MYTVIGFLVFGLVAGLVARFLVPGRDPMGLIGTMVLGIVGSFVGGFVYNFFMDGSGDLLSTSGWIGSIAGAVVLLILMRLFGRNRE
ncbi:MAG: GlsB/YeaQ/YmgE family stress response membrane protein [Myxococcales bacterium]|nr:GlsB/YeaQ/YmgE family stress response membrane protein [Myxococcales bacterium]